LELQAAVLRHGALPSDAVPELLVKTMQLRSVVSIAVAGFLLWGCGGGSSTTAAPNTPASVFSVNSAPAISSLAPTAVTSGGPAFTLSVNGSSFVASSAVQWNGQALSTTFVSDTQLTAAVPASDIATAGTATVTVSSPAPGGGTSTAARFDINGTNPAPAIATLVPSSVTTGGAAFTLAVNGSNFVASSTVNWNGAALATTYISDTNLTASVSASDIASAGTASVTVSSPAPGGGTSAVSDLSITSTNPVPAISAVAPTTVTAGGTAFTLTVSGGSFVSSSAVNWNGAALATTFVSSNKLTASVSAADVASAGTASVTVSSPAPGGGKSGVSTFTITSTNLVPTISALAPASVTAGSAAFTLSVDGSGFVSSSKVNWNGAALTTTFVSDAKLSASVPASSVAASGSASVTVSTPAPGGGTSGVSTENITSTNPVPAISALAPTSTSAGGAAFTLTVNGNGFVSSSKVNWSGAALPTTYVSASQLTAAVPASDIAGTGSASISVTNPAPGGGTSATAPLTVSASAPTGAGTTGQITVNAASTIAPISANQLGTNMAVWYNVSNPGVAAAVAATGAHLVRWPGGSTSDTYHWATNTACNGGYANPGSTFDNFMQNVIVPNGNEVVLTINYGSNSACNGGGDPTEAAAWVADVVSKGYNVHHYTVGNEVYGSWEYDLHSVAHDPTTYANAVGTATSGGYYQLMKAQDPTAQIGVVVENQSSWDSIVLSKAKFDFVELHDYVQSPGAESDSYLLTQAPAAITAAIASLRSELVAAGLSASTPILLGEFNSVYTNPGKQSLSIVNGLFTGMTFGELLNDGVPMSTWYMATGGGCTGGADSSSAAASLYGWQNFGSYDQVSDGWGTGGCASNSQAVPAGTVLPSGYAEQLASSFAVAGNMMLSTSVSSSLANVRAYAATQGSGFALMLFNLDETASATVTVGVSNTSKSAFVANTVTYGKAQYDNSQNGVWTAPVAQSLGTVSAPVSVTLPPWSMTILKLQ
jgi:hypothetical protein